jgi:AraC family transcriptional regulator, transcriptional activator of pobA
MGEEIIDETLSALEGVRQVFNQYGMFTSSIEIRQIFKNIAREHIHMDFARAHILRALSGQLIGQIARLISTQFGPSDTMPNTLLNRKFEALLDAKFQFQWSVAQYATALAVTPGHLSRVMRDATGLSASKNIDARIVREAKRNLTYTSLTISEIAYDLGYIDPAYFSRVFTRTAGISPRQFRQNLLKRS